MENIKCFFLLILCIAFMNNMVLAQRIEEQPLPESVADNGINICLDSAHQFLFFWHWTVQDFLRKAGFRVTGNMQVLNKTLVPGKFSVIREQYDHDFNRDLKRKFVLLPNPKFNAVVTYQFGPYQDYTIEEIERLKTFVNEGGGLIIFGRYPKQQDKKYPIQGLASIFGAEFSHQKTSSDLIFSKIMNWNQTDTKLNDKKEVWTIKVDRNWKPIIKSKNEEIVIAIRNYGKGRVVLSGDDYLNFISSDQRQEEFDLLVDLAKWASSAIKPVGGDRKVPWEYGGVGGAIYPSNREEVAGVTVFFADNQHEEVISTIRTRTMEVKQLLDRMIPSPHVSPDEFFIIPAAGAGGGWAVNVYTPKSASICSNRENTDQLLSIMAHEIAHTMTGPAASDGSTNGMPPEEGIGLFSEAHAGWFQKKVTEELGIESPSHDLSDLAIIDPTLRELNLQNVPKDKPMWGWKKLWFLYSILEYQFGEGFYASWMREIHELCKNKPKFYQINWQETLITLSRAINADVFPFFKAYGTKIDPPECWEMPPMKSLIREEMTK